MNKIIKQIRQKSDSGFSSSINIGAEQRYVGALRQSHNDNLEEQSILGVDCITTESWNGNICTTIKEFHDGTQTTNYYKLVTIFKDINFENNRITSFVTIKTDNLYFVNNEGEEKLISTKITQKKVVDNVVTIKEIISRK